MKNFDDQGKGATLCHENWPIEGQDYICNQNRLIKVNSYLEVRYKLFCMDYVLVTCKKEFIKLLVLIDL